MGRVELAVLTVATVAVGLFVLRVTSAPKPVPMGMRPSSRDAAEPSGPIASADVLPPQARAPASHEDDVRRESGAAGGARRIGRDRRPQIPPRRSAIMGGTAQSDPGAPSGGAAATGRGPKRGGNRAVIADGPAPRRLGARGEEKRELVELLASRPRTQSELFADAASSDEPKEGEGADIALHLPLVEDVQAKESAPIEETGIDRAEEGEGMTFTEDAVLAFPDAGNASGNGGTISLEIEPSWHGSDETNNAFVNIRSQYQFENRLQLVKNGRYLRLILADDTGHETGVGLTISGWEPGERHRVTATWGDGVAALYVDGRFVGEAKYEGQLAIPAGTPMFVGSDHAAGYSGANATLRDFTVYRRPLSADEALAR